MTVLQGTGGEVQAFLALKTFRSELWVDLKWDAQGNGGTEKPDDFQGIFMICLHNSATGKY